MHRAYHCVFLHLENVDEIFAEAVLVLGKLVHIALDVFISGENFCGVSADCATAEKDVTSLL